MSGSRPSQTRSGTWPKRRARGRWTRTEMFFVEARYHRSPDRAAGQVRYIAHREEGLTDGRRRELYGIGERYRALRGDEPAIRRALREDARGLRKPPYFRFIMTVDNPTAERFRRLDGPQSERVMRDAIDKTFRGALRGAQGVFAVHHHGGAGRAAHPHVHALLSPRFENRMAVHISPVRIQRVKERWEQEVLADLQSQERRLDRIRQGLGPRLPIRLRDRDDRLPLQGLPFRPAPRRDGQLDLFPRGEESRPSCARGRLGQAVATLRLAGHAMGAESREGGPPSRVPARVEGHAPGHSRRAVGAARPPGGRPPSAIGAGRLTAEGIFRRYNRP